MQMTRKAVPSDRAALITIAESCGLFSPDELPDFISRFDDWTDDEERGWFVAPKDVPSAAAYLEPEAMSDNVWNLRFIGVVSDRQRTGLGRALLSQAEAAARESGGRLMLIETASIEEMAPARALYTSAGYTREAQIRDFYGDGIDRLTFARRL